MILGDDQKWEEEMKLWVDPSSGLAQDKVCWCVLCCVVAYVVVAEMLLCWQWVL